MFNKSKVLDILRNLRYDVYTAMKAIENSNFFEYVYLKKISYDLKQIEVLINKEKDENNNEKGDCDVVDFENQNLDDVEK